MVVVVLRGVRIVIENPLSSMIYAYAPEGTVWEEICPRLSGAMFAALLPVGEDLQARVGQYFETKTA